MIDIDHCVENGKLSPMAQEIVELMDSYTEYSPSGTGVHIIAKINKFKFDATQYYINNRKLGLEVYVAGTTNKYLTITGNVICDKAPQYRDAELAQLVTGYMKRSTVENKNEVVVPGSFLSDESVIQKIMASKQADKFKPLWEGEIPEGKSHSEADMTLVQVWHSGVVEM
jgi:putative DNA primase/helicase